VSRDSIARSARANESALTARVGEQGYGLATPTKSFEQQQTSGRSQRETA
jgi:hypothetical protein